ncbi:MAG: hypothetical protein H0U74_10420 [Bradymonadaceae bacterium]|nr:hypothetical protein [Lujinxingiaceae bacterium]
MLMCSRSLSQLFAAGVALAVLAHAAPASASPWTLPQDELVIGFNYTYQGATSEYLADGTYQDFPLEGQFLSHTMHIGSRYGFTPRFEGAVDLVFKQVTYQALPLILGGPDEGSALSAWNDSIIDFNTVRLGAGDFHFHGRYNLRRGLVMITSETSIKLPTGYEQPQGTFDEMTGEVRGQATMGDGQTDLTQSLLVGAYVPATGGFARLDMGLRLRFGSPGHQAVAGAKIGQPLGSNLVVFAGARGHYTLTEGEQIGVTMVAVDPAVARSQFSLANVRAVPLRLDSDQLTLEGGALIRLGTIELAVNYGYTAWGRNTAAVHSLTIGTGFAIPNATASTAE